MSKVNEKYVFCPIDEITLTMLEGDIYNINCFYDPEDCEEGEEILATTDFEEIRRLTGAVLEVDPNNYRIAEIDAFLSSIVCEQNDWDLDFSLENYEDDGCGVSFIAHREKYDLRTRMILTKESLAIVDALHMRMTQSV